MRRVGQVAVFPVFAVMGVLLSACAHPRTAGSTIEVAHPGAAQQQPPPAPGTESFSSLMSDAMMTMHHGMNVPYSDNVDRDFAAMMIPHHQGAVDMALLELRFGHDERLRRLAQGIIVEQRQEIEVMEGILTRMPPTAGQSSATRGATSDHLQRKASED